MAIESPPCFHRERLQPLQQDSTICGCMSILYLTLRTRVASAPFCHTHRYRPLHMLTYPEEAQDDSNSRFDVFVFSRLQHRCDHTLQMWVSFPTSTIMECIWGSMAGQVLDEWQACGIQVCGGDIESTRLRTRRGISNWSMGTLLHAVTQASFSQKNMQMFPGPFRWRSRADQMDASSDLDNSIPSSTGVIFSTDFYIRISNVTIASSHHQQAQLRSLQADDIGDNEPASTISLPLPSGKAPDDAGSIEDRFGPQCMIYDTHWARFPIIGDAF
ncbi:hypothetical protein M422DRAFT_241035 [Sphaerobolus stellatus SS14]|nr:hypothetical protein M422DRAFT_241035 [Sphaerobolus stellatus SS14]